MSQIIDVTLSNFEQVVIEGSAERAVVVDFWASWCGPCKAIGPVLEKLSSELDFVLAKVDTENPENQQLAAYMRISSIPDIRVFQGGKIVDVIQGALPEAQMRKRLSKFFLSEEDLFLQQAESALSNGMPEEALAAFEALLKQKPDDKKLTYLKAKALVSLHRGEEAKSLLTRFIESDDFYREAKSLLELMDFFTEASRTDTVEGDAASYRKACLLATQNQYPEALEVFLSLVQKNPALTESPARKAMLTLFGVLGPKHELTWEYRAKLNTLVFI